MKCYKIIIQGYDDECGKDVNNWQSLKLELRVRFLSHSDTHY